MADSVNSRIQLLLSFHAPVSGWRNPPVNLRGSIVRVVQPCTAPAIGGTIRRRSALASGWINQWGQASPSFLSVVPVGRDVTLEGEFYTQQSHRVLGGTMSEELAWLPGWRLRELVVTKQISPVEVTRAALERIERLDPPGIPQIGTAPLSGHLQQAGRRLPTAHPPSGRRGLSGLGETGLGGRGVIDRAAARAWAVSSGYSPRILIRCRKAAGLS